MNGVGHLLSHVNIVLRKDKRRENSSECHSQRKSVLTTQQQQQHNNNNTTTMQCQTRSIHDKFKYEVDIIHSIHTNKSKKVELLPFASSRESPFQACCTCELRARNLQTNVPLRPETYPHPRQPMNTYDNITHKNNRLTPETVINHC